MEQTDKEILNELGSIIVALHDSYFEIIEQLGQQNSDDEKFKKRFEMLKAIGLVQPYEEVKSSLEQSVRISTIPLELGIADIDELIARAASCSQYVKKALDSYKRVVGSLARLDADFISQNLKEFKSLEELAASCRYNYHDRMFLDRLNLCRGHYYKAVVVANQLRSTAILAKSFIGENPAKGFKDAANAFESYLAMCKECPFREYRKQKENPKS